MGLNQPETAELVYEIRHIGPILGKKPATNRNLLTSNLEPDRLAAIPDLTVIAACGGSGVFTPEGCPVPMKVVVPGCADAVQTGLGDVGLSSLGRVVQISFVVKAASPGKRVAATVQLEELDAQGIAHPRGVKHIPVPAPTGTACEDVEIKCMQFSVPEALDPSGNQGSICNTRSFRAKVIANYVDSDFVCCDNLIPAP